MTTPAEALVLFDYATTLARNLHAKHYPEVTQWRPLPDTLGLLTQIDNMVSGLAAQVEELTKENTALRVDSTYLGELLAIIHGDGGHYQAEHGAGKAVAEAINRYHALVTERDALRLFAQGVMESWPEGDVDGSVLQNCAEAYGLLVGVTVTERCSHNCQCADYVTPEELSLGTTCYRKTPLLTGAAIAAGKP